MLRIPHCLDNRLGDGSKVVSPMHRPLLYSPETLFLCFWYSFLLEVKPQGLVRPEGLAKLIKKKVFNYVPIGVKWVLCQLSMTCPQVADGGNVLQLWRV
jgi:hypothetical protein